MSSRSCELKSNLILDVIKLCCIVLKLIYFSIYKIIICAIMCIAWTTKLDAFSVDLLLDFLKHVIKVVTIVLFYY